MSRSHEDYTAHVVRCIGCKSHVTEEEAFECEMDQAGPFCAQCLLTHNEQHHRDEL